MSKDNFDLSQIKNRLDSYDTLEEKYGSLFADVDDYDRDQIQSTYAGMTNAEHLSIYEVNTHLASPTPPEITSEVCPSIAAGVSIVEHALRMMGHYDIHPMSFFTYLVLGLMIFLKNAKVQINRMFALVALCFSLWSFGEMFVHNPQIPKATVAFINNIGAIGWICFPSFSMWCFLLFTRIYRWLKNKLLLSRWPTSWAISN